jgi:hypothetical protein
VIKARNFDQIYTVPRESLTYKPIQPLLKNMEYVPSTRLLKDPQSDLDSQCNKMTCPNCQTLSCYVCRQIITGYEHFGQPPPYTNLADPNKCQLWDSVEKRHHEEVCCTRAGALFDPADFHCGRLPRQRKWPSISSELRIRMCRMISCR